MPGSRDELVELLIRGVEWGDLREHKAVVRQSGYNKSSWKRALEFTPRFSTEPSLAAEPAVDLSTLTQGLPDKLPELPPHDSTVPHAPARPVQLSAADFKQAISNALRYFPPSMHPTLAPEFAAELRTQGHIYMNRFRPTEYEMKAHPVHLYPARCRQGASVMMMIMNNLDRAVAQFPHELVTYGGNGTVFSNWAQYHLTMRYLSSMNDNQTLTLYSGHPMGLFPSHPDAPRVVVTNGMMIPNYSTREMYEKLYALGCTQYGQMTAGTAAGDVICG